MRVNDCIVSTLAFCHDYERSACATLGKRAPSRPKVPDAPDGARDFAGSIARADAPPPRIYATGPVAASRMRKT
jgi:hypothetical protein